MNKVDFLFELGVEELPTKSLQPIKVHLESNVAEAFETLGLNYSSLQAFVSPRRLALLVKELEDEQPLQKVERKGPAKAAAFDENGAPTKALMGFARSCQVEIDELSVEETEKGSWMMHRAEVPGQKTRALLPKIVDDLLSKLPIAKEMRWGDETRAFVRPVHWLVMLYGDEVVPAELFNCQSDRISYGHRVMGKGAIVINQPADYETALREQFVIVDFDKRLHEIEKQITQLAQQHQLTPVLNKALLEEVCALVEWPVALKVDFEERFLEVPQEALIAAMESHQKSFALKSFEGLLAPSFIAIANIVSEKPDVVIAGNKKVMTARLSDAEFFFKQDQKTPLSEHLESLKKVVFHKKLGSLFDKSMRVSKIAQALSAHLGIDSSDLQRAAELAKCDLLTEMVQEFPELQGIMGREYSRLSGERDAVSLALFEQYLPRFADDELPSSALGCLLSVADRLDTLCGIFGINEKPTGAKDPFKCRRHALAIIRILQENEWDISFSQLLKIGFSAYADASFSEEAPSELKAFITDRLVNFYHAQDIAVDVVKAVSASHDRVANLYPCMQALRQSQQSLQFKSLIEANKRVVKILQSHDSLSGEVSDELLESMEEKALKKAVDRLIMQQDLLLESRDFKGLLTLFEELSEPLANFFEAVMVNCDDMALRKNRLNLLFSIKTIFSRVADLTKLQGL